VCVGGVSDGNCMMTAIIILRPLSVLDIIDIKLEVTNTVIFKVFLLTLKQPKRTGNHVKYVSTVFRLLPCVAFVAAWMLPEKN
jgi:hypothetical protein